MVREIARLLAKERNKEVRVMITTWSEKMEARGLAKGKAEGLAKGKAEGLAKSRVEGKADGKAEGKREATLELAYRLLTERFGDLSKDVRQRVAAIPSTEELAQLVERVFRGESLEDLGLA